jgi:hypothetical protein
MHVASRSRWHVILHVSLQVLRARSGTNSPFATRSDRLTSLRRFCRGDALGTVQTERAF